MQLQLLYCLLRNRTTRLRLHPSGRRGQGLCSAGITVTELTSSILIPACRSASALSASDLSHEYSYSSLLAQSAIPQPEDFIIQVVPAPHFKLHSQYIVLPKQMAVRHSIFAGQPVMLSRAEPELEESLDGGNRTISELVIDLDHTPQSKKPRQHLALAVSYEDAATLQKYVPAPSLLHRYNGESLQMAYIDCYLLFSLFPETLAFSRRFHLRIAVSYVQGELAHSCSLYTAVVLPSGCTRSR